MIVRPVHAERPDAGVIAEAAEIIRRGGLVAFPTETVYGLGANALDPEAVKRIFDAKGRPSYNPLIAHVLGVAEARETASTWPASAELAASAFWPGPLTLVVPRDPLVPDIVTAGLDTVALRVPSHPVALALLRASGLPLAAPSANRFTEVSPTRAAHVVKGLDGRIDMILDGGPTAVGIESTVLDLSGSEPVLLRPGSISHAALEAVLGPIRTGRAITGEAARPSPGMTDRHYAPHAELRVLPPEPGSARAAFVGRAKERGAIVGGLVLGTAVPGIDHPVQMPPDAETYARQLYAALHRLDELGCDVVVADEVPRGPEWAGVRDRLARAAHTD